MSTGVVSHTRHCCARAPAVVLEVKLLGEQLELVVAEMDAQLGEHVVELLGSDVASVVGVHRAEFTPQVVPHVVNLQQARHSSLTESFNGRLRRAAKSRKQCVITWESY